MSENALSAETRDGTGKGVARKLRAKGIIPAVVYGKKRAAQSISVNPEALQKLLRGAAGMNTLIDLTLGGKTSTVLVKGLERDPVRGRYLHADFYEVDLTRRVTVSVPVHLVGKAAGIDFGGILDHPLRELLIEAIRYGDQPEVRARLTQAIEHGVDRSRLQDLLEERALAHDAMDASRVARIREDMERAQARRLQPQFIESFFL